MARQTAMPKKKNETIMKETNQRELPSFFVTKGNFDYQILFLTIALTLFGIVMVYSASSYRAVLDGDSPYYFAIRQTGCAFIGFVVMLVVSRINYKWYQRLAKMALLGGILLCAYVLVRGATSHGASRWIQLGPVGFQPSEMAKAALIIYMADVCASKSKLLQSWRGMIKIIIIPIVCVGLIMYENLSTSLICLMIIFGAIFVSSPSFKEFAKFCLAIIIPGILVLVIATSGKGEYRKDRIKTWLAPEKYEDDAFQTMQGLYAIGSGGFFGKGLGQSIQKTGNLPESHNDMIFAIICEELGLFGGLVLITIFILLILRCAAIMKHSPDRFAGLTVLGVIIHIGFQASVNIGVVTNTIPNTGVTLPFISYGGTSLILLMAEIGLVLGVSRQQIYEEEP